MNASREVPHRPPGAASTPSPGATASDVAVVAGTGALSMHDVDRLLEDGMAEPLLMGYRPVPILYRQRWWHLPQGGEDYQPASSAAARVFEDRRVRLQAAAEAVARRPVGGSPRW